MEKNVPLKDIVCKICNQGKTLDEVIPLALVHPWYLRKIKKRYPSVNAQDCICLKDLHACARGSFSEKMSMVEERSETGSRMGDFRSCKDRMADTITELCGSWRFLLAFSIFIMVWMGINSLQLFWHVFDPYPFIFLNLVFSLISAIQAPIILMSQKRQDANDRIRAEHDYLVNRHTAESLQQLHAKIDELMSRR